MELKKGGGVHPQGSNLEAGTNSTRTGPTEKVGGAVKAGGNQSDKVGAPRNGASGSDLGASGSDLINSGAGTTRGNQESTTYGHTSGPIMGGAGAITDMLGQSRGKGSLHKMSADGPAVGGLATQALAFDGISLAPRDDQGNFSVAEAGMADFKEAYAVGVMALDKAQLESVKGNDDAIKGAQMLSEASGVPVSDIVKEVPPDVLQKVGTGELEVSRDKGDLQKSGGDNEKTSAKEEASSGAEMGMI